MTSKHGGKRAGAGRPASRGERKQTTSMRLSPEVLAYLRQSDGSVADVVEDALRRTAAFRRWQDQ